MEPVDVDALFLWLFVFFFMSASVHSRLVDEFCSSFYVLHPRRVTLIGLLYFYQDKYNASAVCNFLIKPYCCWGLINDQWISFWCTSEPFFGGYIIINRFSCSPIINNVYFSITRWKFLSCFW